MAIKPLRTPLSPRPAGCYAVELARSALPFNPHRVPRLDLFDLYRLYRDIKLQGAQALHTLRVGFFNEEHMAKTIARHLSSHFDSPRVVHVEPAEMERAARNGFVSRLLTAVHRSRTSA
jgi:hypothetical protein